MVMTMVVLQKAGQIERGAEGGRPRAEGAGRGRAEVPGGRAHHAPQL